MNISQIRQIRSVRRSINFLGTMVTVIGAISVLGGVYLYWKNNLWKPKVNIISHDFENGRAEVNINGEPRTLYAGSALSAGGDWGVQLAGTMGNDNKEYYDRIELIKNGLVYSVIYLATAA